MPQRAGKACTKPGCPGIVQQGVCSTCGPLKAQRDATYDRERGSAAARGYDRRWQRLRLMYLRANPFCADCATAGGQVTQATEVHHKLAKRDGGQDEWDNLESLCKPCHSKRTMRGE